jgi:hypothetical protein
MKQCHGEPEKTAEIEIAQIASEKRKSCAAFMSFAILSKYSYCPICCPKTSRKMQINAQNQPRPTTFVCSARQLIGQASGLGNGFAVYD